MDAIATHFYGSCDQKDTDATIFANTTDSTTGFAAHVAYFRATMNANPTYVDTPIWVTENNVNADWGNAAGMSQCNAGQTFVVDPRGTTAFFAAWRPMVYSQVAKAGAVGLWHWSFLGGTQYGEIVDDGSKYLSYWVDYYLSQNFGQEPMDIITTTVSEPARIEIFAAQKTDGTRVIMLANRDVASSTDNNGAGVPKTVILDLTGVGAFTTAQLLTIDASTSATTGPQPVTVTPTNGKLTLTSTGYGVQFLTLK
jgi:hypothetical protein